MFQNRLAFLADIFSHLNELNRNLQGVNTNILGLREKITAFIAKLKLWKTKIQLGQRVAVFPMVNKMNETNGINSIIQSETFDHFNSLSEEFHCFFHGVQHDTPMMALTRNPVRVSIEDFPNEQSEDEGIQEEFKVFREASFEDESMEKLWGMEEKAYPKVAEKPLTLLPAFPSSYLCESAFSSVVAVKTKA